MGNYIETAKNIVKESIKSAVYIDENAREPFEGLTGDPTEEQTRSVELYDNFKEAGISLSIFKYQSDKYIGQKEYLFSGRDLVLLDWQLEGEGGGEEKALEILAEIILNQKHIHFCSIYTSQNKDSVLKSILSYFSETSRDEYAEIKEGLDDDEEEIKSIQSDLCNLSFYRFDKERRGNILSNIIKTHEPLVNQIKSQLSNKNLLYSLLKCGFAFNDNVKSDEKLPCPSSINKDKYVLIIQNTVILILNKRENNPNTLIEHLSDQIASYEWGIMQLLGLEFQNILRQKGCFITPEILKVSKESLGFHKKEHKGDFPEFIKNVFVEQNVASVQNDSLTLVESIEEKEYDEKMKEELIDMNVFYNSISYLKNKSLSFGDVFKCNTDYYICITALCDCAHPKNNRFYFAKGSKIKKEDALTIGDGGFISFLNNEEIVKWCSKDNDEFIPTYIKPISFTIPQTNITDGQSLSVFAISEDGTQTEELSFEYITTIKTHYAQRIANHAFTHPVRVGVDFVKINDK